MKKIFISSDHAGFKLKETIKIYLSRKKISFHGISVNIHPNLNYFNNIIPCGLENSKVTSAADLGIILNYKDFDDLLMYNFEKLLKINSLI